MTPADLLTVVLAPWCDDEPRGILRVTQGHQVRVEQGDIIIAVTTWPDHDSATSYAHILKRTCGGRVIDETVDCGGCGPRPSANRCARCAKADVAEDRARDERAWA